MATPEPIPLIRHTIGHPMVDLLHQVGAPVGRLLRRAGLPRSLEEEPAGFVTGRAMFGFVELAAVSQDIPDFCWRSTSRAPVERLGGWGQHVLRAVTLRGAIERFCALTMREISFIQLGLSYAESHALLWRYRPTDVRTWKGDVQGEQFMLGSMVRLVRLVAGPNWIPGRIELESDREDWFRDDPGLSSSEIALQGRMVAIAIPYELLDRRIRPPAGLRADTGSPRDLPLPADTFAGSLEQAIGPLLADYRPSVELAAELARTSPRSLRRRLEEEGASWREVVDRARFEACRRLLRDPERSLTEIAMKLGYSDQANLTRAFRRWTGESPTDYRRQRRLVPTSTRAVP